MNPSVHRDISARANVASTNTAFTPALTATTTDPTLGSGSTAEGFYTKSGRWVAGQGRILFGTSGVNAGSGTYRVSLPVFAGGLSGSGTAGNGPTIGVFTIKDDGSTITRFGVLQLVSASTALMLTGSDATGVSNSNPWTWAASDRIHYSFGYYSQ
jgi:hypothetical protein